MGSDRFTPEIVAHLCGMMAPDDFADHIRYRPALCPDAKARTGRTTTMLLKAVVHALNGGDVLIRAHTSHYAQVLASDARRLRDTVAGPPPHRWRNVGSIHALRRGMRVHLDDTVFSDHYWPEYPIWRVSL